jgi:hypothetical protein
MSKIRNVEKGAGVKELKQISIGGRYMGFRMRKQELGKQRGLCSQYSKTTSEEAKKHVTESLLLDKRCRVRRRDVPDRDRGSRAHGKKLPDLV